MQYLFLFKDFTWSPVSELIRGLLNRMSFMIVFCELIPPNTCLLDNLIYDLLKLHLSVWYFLLEAILKQIQFFILFQVDIVVINL